MTFVQRPSLSSDIVVSSTPMGLEAATTIGNNNNDNVVKALQAKLIELQEELTRSYRLNAEHSSMLLRLKDRAEKDERSIVERNERVKQLEEELNKALEQVELTVANTAGLQRSVKAMRDECIQFREQHRIDTQKINELNRENNLLMAKIQQLTSDQVEALNEMNSIVQLGRAPVDLQSLNKLPFNGTNDVLSQSIILDPIAWSNTIRRGASTVPKQVQFHVTAHKGQASSVMYDSTGSYIVSCGTDRTVKMFKSSDGTLKTEYCGAEQSLMDCAVSSTGRFVIGAGNDRRIYIWSSDTGKTPKKTLSGHTNKIYSILFTPDSQRIVSSSYDRTIRLWRTESGNAESTIGCRSSCNSIALGSDGDLLVSAHLDGLIRFWSLASGKMVNELNDLHDKQATSVAFSPRGSIVATCGRDNVINILDIRTFKPLHVLSHATFRVGANFSKIGISGDDRYLAAGAADGGVYVWDLHGGALDSTLTWHNDVVTSCDWNVNGCWLVSADRSGQLAQWS